MVLGFSYNIPNLTVAEKEKDIMRSLKDQLKLRC
jgi:hypothetical protein